MSVDAEALASAQRFRVGRLATIGNGEPHLVPVVFVVVEGRFWIPIDGKPKTTSRLQRVRNIENNENVALLFDHYAEDWRELSWLRNDGHASISPTPENVAFALRPEYRRSESIDTSTPAIRSHTAHTASGAMGR